MIRLYPSKTIKLKSMNYFIICKLLQNIKKIVNKKYFKEINDCICVII